MKHNKAKSMAAKAVLALAVVAAPLTSCTDLDEKVFDRVDASLYYQDEASVIGAVAPIYSTAATGFGEYFYYLQEFSADQVAWRAWNDGQWGWDEAEKLVLDFQQWTSESVIISQAWNVAWKTIGLCNTLISDLEALDPASIGMTAEQFEMYIAEVRTMRAWAYYNNFELWGGALPLNVLPPGGDIPGSASTDFNEGCHLIYQFICDELDAALPYLMAEDGSRGTMLRMNQAANRLLKMRMLLNSEIFIGENLYNECATLAQEIIDGKYGQYELASDYRDIFGFNNATCPEIIFAFAVSEVTGRPNLGWMRDMPFLPYNYGEYTNGEYSQSGWNCTIIVPSKDNSGTILPTGGTENPKSFLFDYGDKLGAVMDRMNDADVRKQVFNYDYASGTYTGQFLWGEMKANFGTGAPLAADADRYGENLVYVDQLGTFLGTQSKPLETVMSPRWGETNSGVRMMKYPIYPVETGLNFQEIPEVEFRLAEVYYTLAECKMRAGDANGAKALVNQVRQRYFDDKSIVEQPGPGFNAFDLDWMLSEWGLEFLNEGRRRRTDLRRYDKFTQGQWWFFGRAHEDDRDLPAKRDRKYEWFPLPQQAMMVNPGLVQNPNY